MKYLPVLALVLATGCNENNLAVVRLDAIAVSLGDFDDMRDSLSALDVATTPFDGFIVQATYLPEDERLQRDFGAPWVETLLADTDGQLELASYNAVFVNSGTRGLGAGVYNDPLEPDDSLLAAGDGKDLRDACDFADGGGTLVVSDWAYDLVEYCWPDAIEFFGEDTEPDAAQVGMADGEILADVLDAPIASSVGELVTLDYNYSAWALIETVGPDTEVLMTGDAEYQPSESELPTQLSGVPLLVRFATNSGQVLFSTFAFNVQTPALTRAIFLDGIEGLYEGAGSESDTATTSGGTR